MVRIAPVMLQYNPKSFWFDPKDLELNDGDKVIVTTERGTEYGICNGGIIEVEEEAVEALKTPLKPVLRKASEEDLVQVEEMRQKSAEALPIFKQMAAEENENMRPIMVEYLFDGDKAIFFFEAEERIDFRELVRKLASEFKVRVDMRQIGVRDEARLVGGLGHCGQELCCKRLGGEFNPVSIRMAKEQDLSLNPTKISGVCGRLMCCLRYEFDAYKDFKSRAPKQGSKVETPAGTAKVVELNVPREMVTVQLEDESAKRVTFPLSAMDEPLEGEKRPKSIGDVFEEYANPDPFASATSLGLFDTAGFTREDRLSTPEAHHNASAESAAAEEAPKKESSRRRRRRKGSGQDKAAGGESSAQKTSAQDGQTSRSSRKRRRGGQKVQAATGSSSVRPGQKSSALAHAGQNSREGADTNTSSAQRSASSSSGQTHRKSRRRSHKSGSAEHES